MVEVGTKVPEFTLFDYELKKRSLKEFRGKKLVLAFFPGAYTGVCDKEMCTLRDALAKLGKLDAQVIAVSVNDPFALKGFHEDNALNFPLLSDYTRETVKAYGVELTRLRGAQGVHRGQEERLHTRRRRRTQVEVGIQRPRDRARLRRDREAAQEVLSGLKTG